MESLRALALDDLIPIAFIVIWALSAVAGSRKKKKKEAGQPARPKPPPPVAAKTQKKKPSALDEILRQVERELGLERQDRGQSRPPPKALPAPTAPTRVQSREQRPASETGHTPGWHERPSSETRHAEGWHERSGAETTYSAGEHEMGYGSAKQASPVQLRTRRARKPQVPLVKALMADLRTGPQGLMRGLLLGEILGPPLALRKESEQSR